jgi:glycosyltransferase involved in cell wall biosynthesis
VLAQTLSPLEIIAINDGSTDASRSILERYGSAVKIIDQPNAGASVARNVAVKVALGEWLAFIDSDDIWDPTKLEKQIALLAINPDIVGIYCNRRSIDSEGEPIQASDASKTYWPSGQIFMPLILGRLTNCFSPSQAVVKRSHYLECGGFPENQRHAEDWSLWLKLSLAGPILYLIEPLVSYRRHPKSVSRESEGDFGRLESRYQTLNSLDNQIERVVNQQTTDIFKYELFQASLSYGYHCRIRGRRRNALAAYINALRMRPVSWLAYLGFARCLIGK